MTLYIVVEWHEEIMGVFSREERAKQFCDKKAPDHEEYGQFTIEEWDLDEEDI